MTECGHNLNNDIKCCRDEGHDLQHREYVNEPVDGSDDVRFAIYEWDDDGNPIEHFIEQGNAFAFTSEDDVSPETIMGIAIHDAKNTLNTGDVFEIRRKIPADSGEDGIAWYRVPDQKYYKERATATEPLVNHGVDNGELIEFGGYLLLARIKV